VSYKEGSPAEERSESAAEAKKEGDKPKGKLGSGARFAALKEKLGDKKGVKDAGALAAFIGRRKYGDAKMQALSEKGK
jgi:hypothetical protein